MKKCIIILLKKLVRTNIKLRKEEKDEYDFWYRRGGTKKG